MSGQEVRWQDVTVTIDGQEIEGIKSISYRGIGGWEVVHGRFVSRYPALRPGPKLGARRLRRLRRQGRLG